ncbi:hypothetical protein D8674_041711 [Pyrus ussuriensis x Pyrus communis]|uniref:Uncharacterized protein n=1 Tax=Pyrus ussuriensis x Pyrus communis TaxID=2448454 RepID=A0A5N5I119_9ROSA|nr:hypothetical protein D8674_041711 [Pyrus ussuriensis x Pyrus communis]
MALSLAVGTEPLDGLFTINSNPFKMETFDNMLVSWVTQPTARFLLDGMHYHGVLNMAFLSASQRLLQVIEVISKYMSPFVASYIAYANQIHVVLAFYIDTIGIITDFGKHFDGEEYVSSCHFNATCNVDLLAALFVAHTVHIHVMERFLPGPTTSMAPARVLPPVNIVHILNGEGRHILLSWGGYQGSAETEWMRTAYLFHFFTFPNSESVMWFFMYDILCTAWIRPDLLHYLKNYQVVQVRNVPNGSSKLGSDVNGFHKSSMEFLN